MKSVKGFEVQAPGVQNWVLAMVQTWISSSAVTNATVKCQFWQSFDI